MREGRQQREHIVVKGEGKGSKKRERAGIEDLATERRQQIQ